MIKLDRSTIPIPASLNSPETNLRRDELIAHGAWINTQRYKYPYQLAATHTALISFSNNKCCFCEQELNISTSSNHQGEDFSCEHFRPKSKYWWLAYSWDNLFPICNACNQAKRRFDIVGTFRAYQASDLTNIHSLASDYNSVEQPNYIHPEHGDDPETLFTFNSNGEIFATDSKAVNTINTFKLYRYAIQQLRKQIYDEFKEKINDIIIENVSEADKKTKILALFRNYISDSNDASKPFLASRRFLLRNDIRDLILSLNSF